jgi:diadenosine tetraphosphatase ApaH/serine/threonine PP2A family protein phosphatase
MDQPIGTGAEIARIEWTSGSILLFGGPYSNYHATVALRRQAVGLGIPATHVLCTGDLAAYCADPRATVDLIRDWGISVVMGNCEEQLAQRRDDCGCGFSPEMQCDLLAKEWYRHASEELDDETKDWMGRLPGHAVIEGPGFQLMAVHGSVSKINRFVFPSTPWSEKRREIRASETAGIIAGHSGIPFTQIRGGALWHNPGAIGLPANDATPDAWYSLLTLDTGGVRIEHRRLAYDYEAAAERMRCAGLSHWYREALTNGCWPSLDVLPPAEHRRTGRPIAEFTRVWRAPSDHDRTRGTKSPLTAAPLHTA